MQSSQLMAAHSVTEDISPLLKRKLTGDGQFMFFRRTAPVGHIEALIINLCYTAQSIKPIDVADVGKEGIGEQKKKPKICGGSRHGIERKLRKPL